MDKYYIFCKKLNNFYIVLLKWKPNLYFFLSISSSLIQQIEGPNSLLNIISLSIGHIQISFTFNIGHSKLSSLKG